MFVNLKLPSLPVVVSLWKPLTAYEISTVAPATTPPDGSLTTPSMDPEFPICAFAGAAVNNRTIPKTNPVQMLKRFNIFSPSLSEGKFCVWKEAAGKMAVTPAPNRPAHGNTLQARSKELGRGRCAPGAMQGKGIAGRGVLGQRRMPGDDLWRDDEVQPRSRQRRHVQHLADMAGGIGPTRMLVEESAARSKIKQRDRSQQRQRAAPNRSSENSFPRMHLSTLYLSTLDD